MLQDRINPAALDVTSRRICYPQMRTPATDSLAVSVVE
jgi:hypothetical protein